MKNRLLCFVSFLFLSAVCSIGFAQNYYVDNINGDDNNSGTSWENALKTLRHLAPNAEWDKWMSMQHPDNRFFIKATDEPYRVVDATVVISGVGHYYFDATGVGDNRGAKKAKLYGSKQILSNDWVLLSPENSEVKLYRAVSPHADRQITRAYIDGGNPQLLNRTTGLLSIGNLEYYLDGQNKIYLRSDNAHPGELRLEWIADHTDLQGIEGFYNMSIHGVSLKYFTNGFKQGGCHTIEVTDMETSYNGRNGAIFDSGLPEGAKFRNVVAHHNGESGIILTGYNNTMLLNCVSHHNGGSGIALRAGGTENASAVIVHCSSFNNQGAGFEIQTRDPSTNRAIIWTLVNNISASNGTEEFLLADASNPPFALFNGWYGENNDLFNQYSGFSNLENVDPVFVDAANGDYHLNGNSPYIGEAIHTEMTQDIDGDLRDAQAPDIGADEVY